MEQRIAIISQGLSNGGAERVASILANYFAEKGYNVCYVAVYNTKQDYQLDKRINVQFVECGCKLAIFKLLERNKKIFRIIKSFSPKYIYSFLTKETLLPVLKGYNFIYSLRNDPTKIDSNFINRHIRSYLYKKASHVVFQSKGAQDYFSDSIKQKSSIIPNPLEVDKLPVWDRLNHNKSFMTACRLNSQKNLPMMIKAFKKLHDVHPDYSLELYGEGELREQLQELINELKASNYIHLMGRSNNIHEIMSSSFAFLLSSDYEGLSNSMLEALAIGLPCICTDCPPGGARDYITDMENGILVPCGDVESMYEGLKKLIEDNQLCKKFSQNSIAVRDKLKIENIGQQWEQLIRRSQFV